MFSAVDLEKGQRPRPHFLRDKNDLKDFKKLANQIGSEILAGWRHTIRMGGNLFKKIKEEARKAGTPNAHIERMEKYAKRKKKSIVAGGQIYAQPDAAIKNEPQSSKKAPPTPPTPTRHTTLHIPSLSLPSSVFSSPCASGSGSGVYSSSSSCSSSLSSPSASHSLGTEEKKGGRGVFEAFSKKEKEILKAAEKFQAQLKSEGKLTENEIEKKPKFLKKQR
jgi:hypothetical protein